MAWHWQGHRQAAAQSARACVRSCAGTLVLRCVSPPVLCFAEREIDIEKQRDSERQGTDGSLQERRREKGSTVVVPAES
jgi:hypothetical protein